MIGEIGLGQVKLEDSPSPHIAGTLLANRVDIHRDKRWRFMKVRHWCHSTLNPKSESESPSQIY